jgi:hypothetical protein
VDCFAKAKQSGFQSNKKGPHRDPFFLVWFQTKSTTLDYRASCLILVFDCLNINAYANGAAGLVAGNGFANLAFVVIADVVAD